MSNNSIKMVCNNQACINKSPVFRKFDRLREHRCKNCGWLLVVYKEPSKYAQRANEKAKSELEALSGANLCLDDYTKSYLTQSQHKMKPGH